MNVIFTKRGNLDTELNTERDSDVKIQREYHVQAKERMRLSKSRRGHGIDSPSQPLGGTNFADTLISNFWPPESRDNNLCCLSHLFHGNLLLNSQKFGSA